MHHRTLSSAACAAALFAEHLQLGELHTLTKDRLCDARSLTDAASFNAGLRGLTMAIYHQVTALAALRRDFFPALELAMLLSEPLLEDHGLAATIRAMYAQAVRSAVGKAEDLSEPGASLAFADSEVQQASGARRGSPLPPPPSQSHPPMIAEAVSGMRDCGVQTHIVRYPSPRKQGTGGQDSGCSPRTSLYGAHFGVSWRVLFGPRRTSGTTISVPQGAAPETGRIRLSESAACNLKAAADAVGRPDLEAPESNPARDGPSKCVVLASVADPPTGSGGPNTCEASDVTGGANVGRRCGETGSGGQVWVAARFLEALASMSAQRIQRAVRGRAARRAAEARRRAEAARRAGEAMRVVQRRVRCWLAKEALRRRRNEPEELERFEDERVRMPSLQIESLCEERSFLNNSGFAT